MSETTIGTPGTDDGQEADRRELRSEMARALASGGMEDFIIISRESAAAVFTPKRQEIVDHLRRESPGSVRELARQLDRDKGQVSRDLTTLAEHGILTYEDQGRARRPVLTDEHIIVEPV